MPSGVHEILASPFIVSAGIARLNLRPDIEKQLRVVGSQKVGNFEQAYEGSEKDPDVLFRFAPVDDHVCYTAVVEVGLTETFQELVEDVRMCIEGNDDIRTAILIKAEEDPRYIFLTSKLDDDEALALGLPPLRDLNTSLVLLEDRVDAFGPFWLNDLVLVGKMSIFLEIWKRVDTTGDAKRWGPRMVSYSRLSC